MNLRNAAFLLILGALYTLVHKAALGLFPSLGASWMGAATTLLWILGTSALILFAYQFLRELSPRARGIRYSLVSIIVLTAVIILSDFPLWPGAASMAGRRLVFSLARFLNSVAVLVFLLSLARVVHRGSQLWTPLRTCIWAGSLMVLLGVVSTGYLARFLLTGREADPLPFLAPLAVLAFLFVYAAAIWFLIRLRRVGNYAELSRAIAEGNPSTEKSRTLP